MTAKQPKSREQIAEGLFRMYKKGKQWQEKLATGDITENELWEMAFAKADEKIQERLDLLEAGNKQHIDLVKDDQMYREDREDQYREDYDWSIKSDEKILQNLLDVEVNIRQVKRMLGQDEHRLPARDRDVLMDRHSKLVALHADLLKQAGIDRVAREKRKASEDPIEDWENVKELARKKLQQLEAEFPKALDKAQTEAEIRNKAKHHLAYPFAIVDALLSAHRRVLGLSSDVEHE